MLEAALGQMKTILRGTEDNALATFNSSHRSIKDAIKRAAELEQSITEPRLNDLERARHALALAWPFLRQEPDVSDDLRAKATELEDLLARETFYKELPAVEQHTRAIELEHGRRFEQVLSARIAAYSNALEHLIAAPGWNEIGEEQRRRLAAPFERGKAREEAGFPIPQLRSECDACEGRLRAAIAELCHMIDGERVVSVSLGSYFGGGVETEEQLDAALDGVREECSRLIGAGKKVIVQ
jgi:cell division septum initiation protein DivIVA